MKAMWKILLSPDRDLLGGFFRMLKGQKIISRQFIIEKEKQILEAINYIREKEVKDDRK